MSLHSLVGQALQDRRITLAEARGLVRAAYQMVRFGADAAAAGDELAALPWRGAELENGTQAVLDSGLEQLGRRPSEADQRKRDLFVLGLTRATASDGLLARGEVSALLDDAREDLAAADDPATLRRFLWTELTGIEALGIRAAAGAISQMEAFLAELNGAQPRDDDEGPVVDD